MHRNQNLGKFLNKKVTMSWGFSFVNFFSLFPTFPFLTFLGKWLTFKWSYFQFINFWGSIIQTGNFYLGVATSKSSRTEFSCKFFTQIPEHLYAYLRLHWVEHSDHWKESFLLTEFEYRWCPCWSEWRQKWKKRPTLVTVSIGVNGLNCIQICWGIIGKKIFRSSPKVLGNVQ